MILVLCDPGDALAYALYGHLQGQHADVHIVTSADLIFSPYWKHDVSSSGHAVTEIRLQSGLVIESGRVQAVHNRLGYPDAVHFMNAVDKAYAELEFAALILSFLKSVEQALPAPLMPWQLTPDGLSELQLRSQAIALGIPVLDMHFTSSPRWMQTPGMVAMAPTRKAPGIFYRKSPHLVWEDRPLRQVATTASVIKATVAGTSVFSESPVPCEHALLRLARALGCRHLDAYFGTTETQALFLYEVDTQPGTASPEALSSLAESLLQKTEQTV